MNFACTRNSMGHEKPLMKCLIFSLVIIYCAVFDGNRCYVFNCPIIITVLGSLSEPHKVAAGLP